METIMRDELMDVIISIAGGDPEETEIEERLDREDFSSFSEFKLEAIKRLGLQVGENYIDDVGGYVINSIADGKVFIRRQSSGKEEFVDHALLLEKTIARCLKNISDDKNNHQKATCYKSAGKRDRKISPPRKFEFTPSQEFYKSLGWLCTNAEVIIHSILSTLEEKFIDRYREIKKHDVPIEYDVQENLTSEHYGSELRVVANNLPNWKLDTGNKSFEKSHVCSKLEHNFTIYSNNFVWWLLNNGFDFVEHQDVEAIRSNIPEIYKEAFDEGLNE